MPENPQTEPNTQPEATPANDAGATPPADTTPQAEPTPTVPETNKSGQATENPDNPTPEVDPRISKANKEAARYRTERNELQAKVEEAKAEQEALVQKIGKAFGFVQDEDTQQQDAQKLVEQITTERDTLQAELRSLRQENALTSAMNNVEVDGQKVTVDPDLTLAVVKGTGALDGLDPAADDYSAQVARAVSETVAERPQLRTQAVPKSSGQAPTPTNNGDGTLTREDLQRMFEAGQHEEINKAFADRRFKLN